MCLEPVADRADDEVLRAVVGVLVLLQPRLQAATRRRLERRVAAGATPGAPGTLDSPSAPPAGGRGAQVLLLLLTFVIGVYGGYFTAAPGVLLVGAFGAVLVESLQRINAMKNLLSLVVNVVAAVSYTLVGFDRVLWEAVLVIAVGSLLEWGGGGAPARLVS